MQWLAHAWGDWMCVHKGLRMGWFVRGFICSSNACTGMWIKKFECREIKLWMSLRPVGLHTLHPLHSPQLDTGRLHKKASLGRIFLGWVFLHMNYMHWHMNEDTGCVRTKVCGWVDLLVKCMHCHTRVKRMHWHVNEDRHTHMSRSTCHSVTRRVTVWLSWLGTADTHDKHVTVDLCPLGLSMILGVFGVFSRHALCVSRLESSDTRKRPS